MHSFRRSLSLPACRKGQPAARSLTVGQHSIAPSTFSFRLAASRALHTSASGRGLADAYGHATSAPTPPAPCPFGIPKGPPSDEKSAKNRQAKLSKKFAQKRREEKAQKKAAEKNVVSTVNGNAVNVSTGNVKSNTGDVKSNTSMSGSAPFVPPTNPTGTTSVSADRFTGGITLNASSGGSAIGNNFANKSTLSSRTSAEPVPKKKFSLSAARAGFQNSALNSGMNAGAIAGTGGNTRGGLVMKDADTHNAEIEKVVTGSDLQTGLSRIKRSGTGGILAGLKRVAPVAEGATVNANGHGAVAAENDATGVASGNLKNAGVEDLNSASTTDSRYSNSPLPPINSTARSTVNSNHVVKSTKLVSQPVSKAEMLGPKKPGKFPSMFCELPPLTVQEMEEVCSAVESDSGLGRVGIPYNQWLKSLREMSAAEKARTVEELMYQKDGADGELQAVSPYKIQLGNDKAMLELNASSSPPSSPSPYYTIVSQLSHEEFVSLLRSLSCKLKSISVGEATAYREGLLAEIEKNGNRAESLTMTFIPHSDSGAVFSLAIMVIQLAKERLRFVTRTMSEEEQSTPEIQKEGTSLTASKNQKSFDTSFWPRNLAGSDTVASLIYQSLAAEKLSVERENNRREQEQGNNKLLSLVGDSTSLIRSSEDLEAALRLMPNPMLHGWAHMEYWYGASTGRAKELIARVKAEKEAACGGVKEDEMEEGEELMREGDDNVNHNGEEDADVDHTAEMASELASESAPEDSKTIDLGKKSGKRKSKSTDSELSSESKMAAIATPILTSIVNQVEAIANKSYSVPRVGKFGFGQGSSNGPNHNNFHNFDSHENTFVSLYSDFTCDHTAFLSADNCTRLIIALGKQSLPPDEFWLFMLAKRVQNSIQDYSGKQIVAIARSFADRYLEDDEFFEHLAAELRNNDGEKWYGLKTEEKMVFLYSCAKLRYRDEGIIRAAVAEAVEVMKNEANVSNEVSNPNGETTGETSVSKKATPNLPTNPQDLMDFYHNLIMGIGELDILDLDCLADEEFLKLLAKKIQLAANHRDLGDRTSDDWVSAIAYFSIYSFPSLHNDSRGAEAGSDGSGADNVTDSVSGMRDFVSSGVTDFVSAPSASATSSEEVPTPSLCPKKAAHFALLSSVLDVTTKSRGWTSGRKNMVARRLRFIQHCVGAGLISASMNKGERFSDFPLLVLRQLGEVAREFEMRGVPSRSDYEPESSGLHLEVASVLDVMRAQYNLEVKADPFILDLVMRNVTPETAQQAVERREKEAQFRQELELQQKRLQYMFSK